MGEELNECELTEGAMNIILHAGDARIKINEALELSKQDQFKEAYLRIAEAQECIRLAHLSQTEIIQRETRGIKYEPSLLFIHAQDTLMTIMSELNLAKELIGFYEIIVKKLESR